MGFPCSSAGEESACNAGDLVSIPGLGRSPGEGKGYPLQYSGLENSMDHIVHGVAKSWTRLGDFHPLRTHMSSIHQDGQGLNWTLLLSFQVLVLLENGCAPTPTFRELPPALIFCFTGSFFKVQRLLGIGCAVTCPCADCRGGLKGSAWVLGVELVSASPPLMMWEIPQMVK